MEYIRLPTHLGEAILRDLTEPEIPALIDYIFRFSEIESNGIDLKKLGTREDTRRRFHDSIRTGDPAQKSVTLVVTLDGVMTGYTFVNLRDGVANMHGHITDPDMRGIGLISAILPFILKVLLNHFPVDRAVFEPRTRQAALIHVLQEKMGVQPIQKAVYLEEPDGIRLPGEFNIYQLDRPIVDGLIARLLGFKTKAELQS